MWSAPWASKPHPRIKPTPRLHSDKTGKILKIMLRLNLAPEVAQEVSGLAFRVCVVGDALYVLQHLFERHGVVVEVAIFVKLASMEHKRLKVAVLENGM
jgi:hypothetical protein